MILRCYEHLSPVGGQEAVGLKFGPETCIFHKHSCGSEADKCQLTFSDSIMYVPLSWKLPCWKHDQASGPDWLRGEPSMISYYLCSKTNELSVGQQLLGGEFSCSAGMEWSALSWTNWYSVISGEHLAKGVLISHSNYPGRSQSPMC